jgi:hypothetical protein
MLQMDEKKVTNVVNPCGAQTCIVTLDAESHETSIIVTAVAMRNSIGEFPRMPRHLNAIRYITRTFKMQEPCYVAYSR